MCGTQGSQSAERSAIQPLQGWELGLTPTQGCAALALGCARPSLEKEDRRCRGLHGLETFSGDPAGPNPARQRLATSRKRVLRGGPKWPLRSVDSEGEGCVIEPRNKQMLGSSGSQDAATAPECRYRRGTPGSAGVVEQGIRPSGSPQEPGRPSRLAARTTGWAPGDQNNPGPRARVSVPCGSEPTGTGCELWREGERSVHGGGGSRSAPVVPRRPGNEP